MADIIDYVEDDEILYRSVRREDITIEDEKIASIKSVAFADRNFQVSLDRAILRTPEQSRINPTDAVVALKAKEIRAIASVTHNGVQYRIDVRPDPIVSDSNLPDNPAHALIIGDPVLERTGFDKLKQALKKIVSLAIAPGLSEQ